jgi:hypothetical protein
MTDERRARGPAQALDALATAVAAPLANAAVGPPSVTPGDLHAAFTRDDTIRWSLHRITRNALGPEVEQEATARLAAAPAWARAARVSFVAWVELAEALVQVAERRHPEPGAGERKAREVREALAMLRADPGSVGMPPDVVGLAAPRAAGWTVDALVLLLNRYSLWRDVDVPEAAVAGPPAPRRRVRAWVARAVGAIASVIARAARALEPEPRRGAEEAAARAVAAGLARPRPLRGLEDLAQTLNWFAEHRDALVGVFELVFCAVQLARMDDRLDARAQDGYAVDLVLTTLEEAKLHETLDLVAGPVELLLDCIVSATGRVFRKRADRSTVAVIRDEPRTWRRVRSGGPRRGVPA